MKRTNTTAKVPKKPDDYWNNVFDYLHSRLRDAQWHHKQAEAALFQAERQIIFQMTELRHDATRRTRLAAGRKGRKGK